MKRVYGNLIRKIGQVFIKQYNEKKGIPSEQLNFFPKHKTVWLNEYATTHITQFSYGHQYVKPSK